MGKGGDATQDPRSRKGLVHRIKSFDGLDSATVQQLKNDLSILRTIWFQKTTGETHAARLEAFYRDQAPHCEFPKYMYMALLKVNHLPAGAHAFNTPSDALSKQLYVQIRSKTFIPPTCQVIQATDFVSQMTNSGAVSCGGGDHW